MSKIKLYFLTGFLGAGKTTILRNLLENMEGRQELFSGHNYELIRGETLGLRAYLHFDLLRMFAPSFTVGANAAAIPLSLIHI